MESVPPNISEVASEVAEVDWLVLHYLFHHFFGLFYGIGIAVINLGCNVCFVKVSSVFSDSHGSYPYGCPDVITHLYYIYFAIWLEVIHICWWFGVTMRLSMHTDQAFTVILLSVNCNSLNWDSIYLLFTEICCNSGTTVRFERPKVCKEAWWKPGREQTWSNAWRSTYAAVWVTFGCKRESYRKQRR